MRGSGQTFGYKPWSDFGPLGRNRALPSCHSSLYQQRDEEPSSLERGGRAQQQETVREKGGGVERRKQIKQTRGCFTVHRNREEGICFERQKDYTLHGIKKTLKWGGVRNKPQEIMLRNTILLKV